MNRFLKYPLTPLIILLTVNLTVGFLTYRDYGMSWDEPLFYDYADSIRLAYTPAAFAPGFDFYQVFGKSAEDHKIYGPAYLLLARPFEQGFVALGTDMASAWHLVNFLTFQLGLVAFYFLVRRWLEPWPAAAATAFLSWQPVYWGHAFINPKDAPFMVFFLWTLVLGLNFVDSLDEKPQNLYHEDTETRSFLIHSETLVPSWLRGGFSFWASLILAGVVLGLTSAIRVIGPLAGALVFVYFLLSRKNWRAFPLFIAYGLIAIATMFIFWPYLWADPLNRLLEVLKHMSNNPTELAVLFDRQIFRANEMPRRYLPQVFGMTLTEPTWILFFLGLMVVIRSFFAKGLASSASHQTVGQKSVKRHPLPLEQNPFNMVQRTFPALQSQIDWRAPLVVLSLFVFMLAYLLYNKPSVYDGFRHFLFITPPVFVFIGFSLQWLWEKVKHTLWAAAVVLVLLPGLVGIVRLHPYEYAYYNQFVGGVGGAYRTYETEYWLTCYKEAISWARANETATTLHIQREFPLAQYYAEGLSIKDLSRETDTDVHPGDLILSHTRADLDIRSNYRKLPVEHEIGRDGAEFCIIKRKN